LEPFDFGETSDDHQFGAIQNEYEDDLKNDETFGCADPITTGDKDGLAMLSERVNSVYPNFRY
jgi:hypothetical protein